MSWLGLIATALGATATGACPAPVPVAAWAEEIQGAEAAFAGMDEAGFDAGLARAALELPCLDAPVEPVLAARYHRLVGLRLYARGDEAGARLAFAAARAVDPFGVIPTALLPPGHEARALELAASTDGAAVAVRAPRRGALYFDGMAAVSRPTERPTLVQIEAEGVVATSRYLAPGQPLPPYRARLLGPVARGTVAGAGVVFGAATASLAMLAGDARADIAGGTLTGAEADAAAARARGFEAGAAASGTLALSGLVVAAIPW